MKLGIPYSDGLHNVAAELRHRATLLQRRDELNTIILSAGNSQALEALLLEAKKSDPETIEREAGMLGKFWHLWKIKATHTRLPSGYRNRQSDLVRPSSR